MPVVIHSHRRKKVARQGMQVERAVRLVTVQEHRDADDGDYGSDQSSEDPSPTTAGDTPENRTPGFHQFPSEVQRFLRDGA